MTNRTKKLIAVAVVISLLAVVALSLNRLSDRHPHFDTAGEIVYASDQGSPGTSHIFVASGDDITQVKQLTFGGSGDADPSFSPDGSEIAFVSQRAGSQQVYIMAADGEGQHAVSFGSDTKASPEFSPNGNRLAYLSRGQLIILDTASGQTSVVLPTSASLTSTNTQQVANAARAPVISFQWSPTVADDQLAAIQESSDGDLQTVVLVPAAGGKPKVIGTAQNVSTAWSFDGKRLAVAALGTRGGPKGQQVSGIALINSDGTPVSQQPLAYVPTGAIGPQNPTFNPKGTKIAFDISQRTKLGTVATAGIAYTAITPGSQPQTLLPGAGHDPMFQPGAAQLLLVGPSSSNPAEQCIYLLKGAGTPSAALVRVGSGNETSPQWSPAKPA